jgi:putative endonuclease
VGQGPKDLAVRTSWDTRVLRIVPMKRPAVYLMTNERRAVLYAGVTSDLVRRASEHRSGLDPGAFTSRYRVRRLVCFETFDDMEAAIRREKRIKGWLRRRKVALSESRNPCGRTSGR